MHNEYAYVADSPTSLAVIVILTIVVSGLFAYHLYNARH